MVVVADAKHDVWSDIHVGDLVAISDDLRKLYPALCWLVLSIRPVPTSRPVSSDDPKNETIRDVHLLSPDELTRGWFFRHELVLVHPFSQCQQVEP